MLQYIIIVTLTNVPLDKKKSCYRVVTLFVVLVSHYEDTVWNFRNMWFVTHALPIVTHLKFQLNNNYSYAN